MARTLLLELGCEELPTSFVDSALEQLPRLTTAALAHARIAHGTVRAYGTARRLTVLLEGVAERIEEQTEQLLGPAESAARDARGQWTKAAEGFARKLGLGVEALSVVDTPKGRYLQATRVQPGGDAREKLPAALAQALGGIAFGKSMRWADLETPFGRPVQWIVALYGAEVLPLEAFRLRAGRETRGHRFLAPAAFELADAESYLGRLREAHVWADVAERRARQEELLFAAAKARSAKWVRSAFLEGEVLGLVEEPHVVVGGFDEAFLALPEALIETVMSHHQRYFALRNADTGALLPLFATTVNTALAPEKIQRGNERVLRARLSDARFFVEQDQQHTLASRLPRLEGVVYHQRLGTYADKVHRLRALAGALASSLRVDAAALQKAAELCKADLVSLTVGEFPELQGTMGSWFARREGLDEAVSAALGEHYLPRSAEEPGAPSPLGAALAIVDRLDTLACFFAIGQAPSGGGDPFGLRRAAIGLLRTLAQHKLLGVELRAALREALAILVAQRSGRDDPRKAVDAEASLTQLVAFLRERAQVQLEGQRDPAVVRACLAATPSELDFFDLFERAEALSALRGTATFDATAKSFERVFNISAKADAEPGDLSLLTLPAERALAEAWSRVAEPFRERVAARDFASALKLVAESLPEPIDRFFTEVFVMDEKLELRRARLSLLRQIADTVGRVARFDALAPPG